MPLSGIPRAVAVAVATTVVGSEQRGLKVRHLFIAMDGMSLANEPAGPDRPQEAHAELQGPLN